MYIVVMACATVIVAQIAPPAGLDTSACPLNSFVPSLATLDDVCCAGGACEGGGLPKSCSVDCAIVFVPFRDRCRATIDNVYDGSDNSFDGAASQFTTVYNLCVAIDVGDLLDRINTLREEGCVVPMERDAVFGGHRYLQIALAPVGGCGDFNAFNAVVGQVNAACCADAGVCPAGVPKMCEEECALEFVPFFRECQLMLALAAAPEQVQKFADLSAECLQIPAAPLLHSIISAECDPCESSPCQNGGACARGDAAYTCACAAGYFGAACEDDPCEMSPCLNGGVCTLADAQPLPSCECNDPFFGAVCGYSERGQQLATLTGHTHYVRTLTYDAPNNLLFSGSYDQSIKIWRA